MKTARNPTRTKQVKAQEEPCRLNKSEFCSDFRTRQPHVQKTDQRATKDSEYKNNFKKEENIGSLSSIVSKEGGGKRVHTHRHQLQQETLQKAEEENAQPFRFNGSQKSGEKCQ